MPSLLINQKKARTFFFYFNVSTTISLYNDSFIMYIDGITSELFYYCCVGCAVNSITILQNGPRRHHQMSDQLNVYWI